MPDTKVRPLVVPRLVRRWARRNGIPVGERGRIDASLIVRYRVAYRDPDWRVWEFLDGFDES